MLPYIYLYIFIILVYLISLFSQRNNTICFTISVLVVWLFIALRAESVGTDTTTYCDFYRSSNLVYLGLKTDIGFEFVGRLLKIIGVHIEQFIFVISTIYLYGLYFIVNKLSHDKTLSLVLFSIIGTNAIFLFIYMSMVRQGCSISIFLIAVYLLFTYRKKYLLLSSLIYLFAVSIHGSMLFTLPIIIGSYVYDIPSKKYWYIAIILTYVMAAFSVISVSDILHFMFRFTEGMTSRDYSGYAHVGHGYIEKLGLFNMNLLPFSVIGLYMIYFSKLKDINIWYVKLFLISIVLNNVFYDNLMWSRLILPFTLFSIIAIPNIAKTLDLYKRWGLLSVVFLYFMYKTYSQLIHQLSPFVGGNIIVPYESIIF